jgi:protein O-mannosyl-transferase
LSDQRHNSPSAAPSAQAFTSPLVLGALLVLAVFPVYLPAFSAGWFWDDFPMLLGNPMMHAPDGLRRIWFSTEPYDWFPLTYSSLWLEWRAWGANAAGFHAVNIALHALGVVLLWRALAALRVPGAWWAALLFAVHPLNVSSVAWITELKNTLSGVFSFAAALAWLRWDARVEEKRRAGANAGFPWAALALFVLAGLGKSSVVMLPPVLLLCAWWRRGKITRSDALRIAPFFVVSLALGLAGIWFQNHRAIGERVIGMGGAGTRIANAAHALWFYAGKTVAPLDLNIIYPQWPESGAWMPMASLVCVAAVLLVGLLKRAPAWQRAALFAAAVFTLMLFPVLGFFRMYYLRYSPVADHWAYLALPALLALFAAQPWRRELVCGAAALACGALTFQQAALFQNQVKLWEDVLAKNPQAWVAHLQLAAAASAQGDDARSFAHYDAALALDPSLAEAHFGIGVNLMRAARTTDAIAHFERAVALKPRYVEALVNLGVALADEGRMDEGIARLREAVAADPASAQAFNNLGWVLLRKGDTRGAITALERAVELAPGYAKARANLDEARAREAAGR